MFRSLLIAATTALPIVLFATTIVVVKTQRGVVVGADSAVARNGSVTRKICKIVVTENCVFAASGSYYPEHGLDVFAIAKQACGTKGDLSAKTSAYIDAVLPPLNRYLEWDRTTNPEHYEHLRQIGASEVVFIDRHSLEAIRLWFPIDSSGNALPRILDKANQPLGVDDFVLIPVGEAAEIYKAIKQEPNWYEKPEESVLKFLQLETTANPLKVGQPFSILRIDNAGAHWFSKGACE